MPEANLFLLFSRRLNALGLRYMVSGSVAAIIYGAPRLTNDTDEKHLRDIRSMLDASLALIESAELEQHIAERGLQEAWKQVRDRAT
jgi:hypothetical protein